MSINFEDIKVNKLIYYNKQSRWGIFTIPNTQDIPEFLGKNDIAVAGNFEGVYEGCKISFTSDIVIHPKYGKQLQLHHYRVLEDNSSEESIVNFLTKSAISGIHKVLAQRIYDEFKEKSIHVVLHETSKLLKIKGIGDKTYKIIQTSVVQYLDMEELLNFCSNIGLRKFSLVAQIYKEFGKESVQMLKENPYQLLLKSESLSFSQIDEIAMKIGIPSDDDNRLKYGLLYVLNRESLLSGSTGCSDNHLKQVFLKTLGLNNTQLYRYIITLLINEETIYRDDNNIFLRSFYKSENHIAEILKSINNEFANIYNSNIVEEEINNFTFTLNDDQVNAINSCLTHQFNIITSLAGCGKSTISKAIIRILSRHNNTVHLLAPTAKAAKRLGECTGYSASTIHKFLKIKDSSLDSVQSISISRNTTILIDEASMVDVRLFEKVLEIIQPDTRIILVGDTHQLPSVQAGNLLEDLINSKKFNVCFLTDITRQADDSNIIKYSNKVNKGEYIPLGLKTKDLVCTSISKASKEKMLQNLAISYEKNVEQYGLLNVQVICAYKQGALGVNNVNNVLRDRINKNKSSDDDVFPFLIGDKVRHTINNYDLDVFNGEVGIVVDIIKAEDINNDQNKDLLVVDFGDKIIHYDKFNYNELTLSFASTVHSSQGSEYDIVYVILDNEISNILMVRKIVYTAMTRAKKKCYIISVDGCVNVAISNNHYKERLTKLKDFLVQDKD